MTYSDEQTPDCNCRARGEHTGERSLAMLLPTVYMPSRRAKELLASRRSHDTMETAVR
jgi:hypothetical protein